jgi:hypothetical protein
MVISWNVLFGNTDTNSALESEYLNPDTYDKLLTLDYRMWGLSHEMTTRTGGLPGNMPYLTPMGFAKYLIASIAQDPVRYP